jgi:hypothetical protein
MKKYIIKSFLIALSLVAFIACESDPVLFDSSKSFVAFQSKTASVKESPSEEIVKIPVVLAAVPGSPSVTVDFEVVTEGATAFEGEDFEIVNESNSLTFSDGLGTEYIEVKVIDNDVFTGDKTFTIQLTGNSQNYQLGAISSVVVTLVDDEHPLKLVLGDYVFSGLDAWGGEFSVNVTTSAVDGDLTQIQFPLAHLIPAYGPPADYMVYARVDLEEMKIFIKVGQSYESFGYGACKISGYKGAEGDPQLEDGDEVVGVIDENGNITMEDYFGVLITEGANEGLSFTIFSAGSVWTKQ